MQKVNLRSVAAWLFERTRVGQAYQRAANCDTPREFVARALAELKVTGEIVSGSLDDLPSTGPLLIVANHPFGGLDGLLLFDLVSRRRTDVRLVANRLLGHITPLEGALFPVDVFGGGAATARNALALRRAVHWLREGHCLCLFPAGEVAHRLHAGRTVDSPWQDHAATIARRAKATVLPVAFEGGNSRLFRAAGRVHPRLRTWLLPRELFANRSRAIRTHIGQPLAAERLSAAASAGAATAWLRATVDELAAGCASAHRSRSLNSAGSSPRAIARPADGRPLVADIDALDDAARIVAAGDYEVFCAGASQLPAVLPEIGRLRELAFRAVGEGSGKPRDLDRFDETYRHLFVWDRRRREIAGAYRVGATDELTRVAGVHGLYTRTLFDYDQQFVDELGPALELGRSFVSPAYQRDFLPLMLLWKGIARLVVDAPKYRRLFGVVSISDRYQSMSRQLLISFLQSTRFDADLGRLVRAKHPPAMPPSTAAMGTPVIGFDDVSARVRALEPDGKDVPILLKQYLKLNARLLGFSIDPAFSHVLDGLMAVDLTEVEPAILARYMGRSEAQAFLSRAGAVGRRLSA